MEKIFDRPFVAGCRQRSRQFARRKPVVQRVIKSIRYRNWMATSTGGSWPGRDSVTLNFLAEYRSFDWLSVRPDY